MKMIDLICASPASTAICSSLDHRSIVRHGTRPTDRKSSKSDYTPACSSELPASPCSPYSRKGSARLRDLSGKSSAEDNRSVISSVTRSFSRRKSSAEDSRSVISSVTRSVSRRKSSAEDSSRSVISSATQSFSRRKSSADDISDLKSRPVAGSSSRFLLSDTTPYIDWISESDHHEVPEILAPSTQHANNSNDFPSRRSSSLVRSRDWISEADNVSDTGNKPSHMCSNDSPALRSSSSTRSRHQVVVLRVSIHCKGCEGKVRKHISKMEGVTSFSIDFGAKKVTVIGDVTPSGVLASISKVKNAQLWPSATTSPSPSPSPLPRWST